MWDFVKKYKWLLLALLVATLAGRMLLTGLHFYTHDDIEIFRLNEFMQCFRDGQIPCRWSANLGKGYGYPWFEFYAPMIYVVPSLLHTIGFSLVASLNLFEFLTFLLAAWAMYTFAKELTKRDDLAALASVLYTLYPFHAINAFIRGVYAENLCWSLAPLIMLGIYRLVRTNKWQKSLPFLFAAIYVTHIISSFVVTGIAAGWLVALLIVHKKPMFRNIIRFTAAVVMGIGIAAFYFIPVIAEKQLVQTGSLISGYFTYSNHFVSLGQLFTWYVWNYNASVWGIAKDDMPFMVGHIHTILLGVALMFTVFFFLRDKKYQKQNTKELGLVAFSLAAFGFLIFLTHGKSEFLWKHIVELQYVQFPWRFVAWAGIPLVTAIILLLSTLPKKLTMVLLFATFVALPIYSYRFFFPRYYDQYTDVDYLAGSKTKDQMSASLYDYLPDTVHKVPENDASSPLYTKVDGVTAASVYARTSNHFVVTVTDEHSATLTLSEFYFPGWTGTVNGRKTTITPDPSYGLITITVPAGKSIVDLHFGETPLRALADCVTIASLGLYGLFLVKKPH